MNKSKFRKLILINSNLHNKNLSKKNNLSLKQLHSHKSLSQDNNISTHHLKSPPPLSQSTQIAALPLNNSKNEVTSFSSSSQIFEDSYRELFSSRNNSLSKAFVFNINQITNQAFSNKVGHVMEQYKYNSYEKGEHKGDVSRLFPKISRDRYIIDREKIKNILRKTKQIQKSESLPNMKIENDDKKIKFEFLQEHFKNPMQSFFLIQKNKIIYESMIQNFENFEKDMYKRTFSRLNPLLQRTFEIEYNKGYKPQQKVKIATKIPKIVDTSWFNPTQFPQRRRNHPRHPQRKESNYSITKFSDAINTNSKQIPSISLVVTFIHPITDFPESREQFAFPQLGSDCIMCGGLVSNKNTNIVWEFNPELLSWKKPHINVTYPEPRYGHTGVIHNKKLIIFGGKYLNLSTFGDIEIYNMETKIWSTPSLLTFTKAKLRRNHIACLIGYQMFIHGGIDEDGNYLNDCYILHLNSLKWTVCSINEDITPPYLAYHKCCLVLPEEIRINPKLNIYRFPDMGVKRLTYENIKERGIYIFGGKRGSDGKAISDLYILRIGRRPLEWAKIRTQGIGPTPRYACSLNFYEEGNCLVVHGGRNDGCLEDFALNDTYMLELFMLNWMRVDYCYEGGLMRVNNRCAHEALIYHHKLIIFGGMNSDSYLGSHLCVIDFSSGNRDEDEEEVNTKRMFNSKINKKEKHKKSN